MSHHHERPAPAFPQYLENAGWVAVPQCLCLLGRRFNLKAPLWQSPYGTGLYSEKEAVTLERQAELTRALLRHFAQWGRKTALKWLQVRKEGQMQEVTQQLFI